MTTKYEVFCFCFCFFVLLTCPSRKSGETAKPSFLGKGYGEEGSKMVSMVISDSPLPSSCGTDHFWALGPTSSTWVFA